MASSSPAPAPDAFVGGLTADHFQEALNRHLDASKPDPLAKRQMENLLLSWEPKGDDVDGERQTLRGTLTLSSDMISVAIYVSCKYRFNDGNQIIASRAEDTTSDEDTRRFENEFYIELTASASFVPVADHNASAKGEKIDRKECATRKKLRGMIDRFRADTFVRRLLVDESDGKSKEAPTTAKKIPLCEALIQQNQNHGTGSAVKEADELEERVNVQADTLEGIRRAIFSHTEDNLDVLELLLNMPFLPRSPSTSTLSTLAERAYLRLLEDAMFDACEREGEDELLDDLNISDANHDDDATSNDNDDGGKGKGRRKNAPSGKRTKSSETRGA